MQDPIQHSYPLTRSNWRVASITRAGPGLHAYDSGSEAKAGLGRYIDYYNHERPHSKLGGRTPRYGLPQRTRRRRGVTRAGSSHKKRRLAVQKSGATSSRATSAVDLCSRYVNYARSTVATNSKPSIVQPNESGEVTVPVTTTGMVGMGVGEWAMTSQCEDAKKRNISVSADPKSPPPITILRRACQPLREAS